MKLARTMMTSSMVMLLDHLLKMGAIFLVTPWMARGLGTEQYGLWLLAMSLVGYLGLIDFGVTLAGSRYLARHLGSGNEDKLAGTAAALRSLYRHLGLACLAGVMLLSAGSAWFFRDESWKGDLLSIVITLGLGTAVKLWWRLPAALLRGHLAYAALVWASIARTAVQAAGAWLVLYYGAGFKVLTLIYLGGELLELGLQTKAARNFHPVRKNVADEATEQKPEIIRYALQSLAGTVALTLRGQVPPLAIAWALGVGMIPVYSIAMRLIGVVEDSLGALFGGQWLSAFSHMEGKADAPQEQRKWIQRLLRYATTLAATALAGLLLLGRPFLEIWLGPDFRESHRLLCILAFPTLIYLAQWPARALIASSSYYGVFTRWSFAGAAVVGGGSFPVSLSWGIEGVVWLLAVHHLIIFGWLLTRYISRITSLTAWEYWAPSVRVSALLALVTWAYGLVAAPWLVPDYGRLFLAGCGLALLCMTVFWFTGLDREERTALGRLVKSRLSRQQARL